MEDTRSLSDDKLLSGVAGLVRDDNENDAEMLRYLDEVEKRGLHLRLGHSSMWSFCIDRFHMSEPTASKRIGSMRTARRFPFVLEMIARGEIHLSGLCVLKAHLTDENHREVLAEAKHKKVRELEQLVARLAPQPDVSTEPVTAPPKRAPDPKPLSPRSYKATMTFDEETMADLTRLQALLAPQIPDGDPAKIVKRALRTLREQAEKRKLALTDAPRSSSLSPSRRNRKIPAAIRRAVHARDGGQCGFVGDDGTRCAETRRLEFAHVEPYAKGGVHSVDNVGERCRAHNQYEADRDFGPLFMKRKKEEARSVREAAAVYVRLADYRSRESRSSPRRGQPSTPSLRAALGDARGPAAPRTFREDRSGVRGASPD
jgi:hypothetical protein